MSFAVPTPDKIYGAQASSAKKAAKASPSSSPSAQRNSRTPQRSPLSDRPAEPTRGVSSNRNRGGAPRDLAAPIPYASGSRHSFVGGFAGGASSASESNILPMPHVVSSDVGVPFETSVGGRAVGFKESSQELARHEKPRSRSKKYASNTETFRGGAPRKNIGATTPAAKRQQLISGGVGGRASRVPPSPLDVARPAADDANEFLGASPRVADGTAGYDSDDSIDQHRAQSNASSVDSEDSDVDSATSGTTMSSTGRVIKKMQERPMILYMVLLICCPLLFLTVYQAIQVDWALTTLSFMEDHEAPIEYMIELQGSLQHEMLAVSELVGHRVAYGISGETPVPAWAPASVQQETDRVNSYFASTTSAMHALILEVSAGDSEMPSFHKHALHLPAKLSEAEVASRRNQGNYYRKIIQEVLIDLSVMFADLQKEEHTKEFSIDLVNLQLLSRIEDFYVRTHAVYRELEMSYNESMPGMVTALGGPSAAALALRPLCKRFVQLESELLALTDYMIKGSGNPAVEAAIVRFVTVGYAYQIDAVSMFIECDFSSPVWRSTTDMLHSLEEQRNHLEALQHHLVYDITHNAKVKETAVAEGMKLMGAMIASFIGVAIVIYIQVNERKELYKIIDHSEKLTLAVRRFVPKNQLKTMGIRSVLQVTAGHATEVSQTMLFSDIRSFTTISEKMTRLELFDWLQSYVERMARVAVDFRGYVDSFIGDALFCVFPQCVDGIHAAMRMQQETDHMNININASTHQDFVRIGVGLHHGVVVAGVFGDESRLSCTLIAPDVNLASRLEGLTKIYGIRICLSRSVIDQLGALEFDLRRIGVVKAAGSGRDLELFDCFQVDAESLKAFKKDNVVDFEHAVDLSESEHILDLEEALAIFEDMMIAMAEARVVDTSVKLKKKEVARKLSMIAQGNASDANASMQYGKELIEQAGHGHSVSLPEYS